MTYYYCPNVLRHVAQCISVSGIMGAHWRFSEPEILKIIILWYNIMLLTFSINTQQLSLCLLWRHMVDWRYTSIHSFSISALDGGELSLSQPSYCTTGESCWYPLSEKLGVPHVILEEIKVCCSCLECNHSSRLSTSNYSSNNTAYHPIRLEGSAALLW